MIPIEEFNQRFLAALDAISPAIKHLETGRNGRHPLLRTALLREVQDDIRLDGYESAFKKWQHFIGLTDKQPGPEAMSTRGKGRPRLGISLKSISDTLKRTQGVSQAALELGCSRGYIYQELGLEKISRILGK